MDKMELREEFHQPALRKLLFEGNFGIRTQMHRILANGRASKFPYPEDLGSRLHNPYLTSGYSDTLMESNAIIVKSARSAVRNLEIIEQIIDGDLQDNERLWPLSLAPSPIYLHDLDYLTNNTTKPDSKEFVEYLTNKYGVNRGLLAGVHVGYSLDSELIQLLYNNFFKEEFSDEATFRNFLYFKLGQGYYMLQWLFTYIFGASPVPPKIQKILDPDLDHQVRSFRNGPEGYGNLPGEQVDYSSFETYVSTLNKFLKDGTYMNTHEFFGPVVLHTKSDDLSKIKEEGVEFISMRMFDLDPFARAGISEDTLNFIELVMVYHLLTPLPDYTPKEIAQARSRNLEVAMQSPDEQSDWMKEEANAFTDKLETFCDEFDAPRRYRLALKFVERRIEDPSLTLSGQMCHNLDNGQFLSFGLKLANDRFTQFVQSGKKLTVIAAGTSISVQRLVRAAIVLGIQVWYHDEVEFEYDGHVEKLDPELEVSMPEGPQAHLLKLFPEVKAVQN